MAGMIGCNIIAFGLSMMGMIGRGMIVHVHSHSSARGIH